MGRLILAVPALVGSLLCLALAVPAFSQARPPPTPALGPPFALPASSPPGFSMGKGGGKSGGGMTFSCLGVVQDLYDRGSPFAYIEDGVVLQAGDSVVVLEGAASSEVGDGVQGAAASIEASALTLQPFDVCASSAGSVLDSVVTGTHLLDSGASGVADVEFQFQYQATLELQEAEGSAGNFVAFSGTEFEVLGVSLDSFEVSAEGGVVSAPPGLSITDASVGDLRRYEISGTYAVEGQLLYGPGTKNVVKTTFYAGGHAEGSSLTDSEIATGFAGAEAFDSVLYEILSLDADVSFAFAEAPE